jgi:hypothetical protein
VVHPDASFNALPAAIPVAIQDLVLSEGNCICGSESGSTSPRLALPHQLKPQLALHSCMLTHNCSLLNTNYALLMLLKLDCGTDRKLKHSKVGARMFGHDSYMHVQGLGTAGMLLSELRALYECRAVFFCRPSVRRAADSRREGRSVRRHLARSWMSFRPSNAIRAIACS